MTAKNRKLCPNCEGSVHIHALKCPYCGCDLSELSASHEPPPPSFNTEPPAERLAEPPPPVYNAYVEPEGEAEAPVEAPAETAVIEPELPSSIVPMLLLIPGAFFLLFGLVMLLFSHDGLLTLSWDAHYWFVYLGLGVPLLYFGWKNL